MRRRLFLLLVFCVALAHLIPTPTAAQPITRDAEIQQPKGLAERIFGQPYIYIVISLVLILLIVMKWKGKKTERPEEKLFWGVEIREKMTDKVLKRYFSNWGETTKFKLYRGFGNCVGIVMKKIPIYKKKIKNKYMPLSDDEIKALLKKKYRKQGYIETESEIMKELKEIKELINAGDKKTIKEYGKKQPDIEELSYYLIAFRKTGFLNLILYLLLHRYEKLLIDPAAITIDETKKIMLIDPNAWIHDHSGVWTLGTKKENILIDELNLQKDIENLKGYTSDMARRVSNQNPQAAMINEKLTHESELKERERRNRLLNLGK